MASSIRPRWLQATPRRKRALVLLPSISSALLAESTAPSHCSSLTWQAARFVCSVTSSGDAVSSCAELSHHSLSAFFAAVEVRRPMASA